jgi:hypothetical protein
MLVVDEISAVISGNAVTRGQHIWWYVTAESSTVPYIRIFYITCTFTLVCF